MSVPPTSTWPWPQRRWVRMLLLFGLFTLIGLWQGNTTYLTMLGDGSKRCWGQPFLWELTGGWAAFLGSYFPIHATESTFGRRRSWWRFFATHGVACALFAAVCPPLFLLMRYVLYPLLGWGQYHYGPLAWRLPMEWQKLVIAYIVIAGVAAFILHLQESRQKTFREAELNARLQEARLQVLSAQLDPHFLFNALNTISSTMYENLDQTDRLLASLGQMLRNSLEGGSALWPLAQELKHLEAFLDFALARFGDRLSVRMDIDPVAGKAVVPRFCLQRLVENSLKHNRDENGQSLSIPGVWTFLETTTTVGIRVSMAPLLNQRLWVPCRVTDFLNTGSAPWRQKVTFPLTVVHRRISDRVRPTFSDFRLVASLHVLKLLQPLSGQLGTSRLCASNQAAW